MQLCWLGVIITVGPQMALLSDRIFHSAHDVFGLHDTLTITLTLSPIPPLGSAPSELHPPRPLRGGASAAVSPHFTSHVQKIKKMRDQMWSLSLGFRAIVLTRGSMEPRKCLRPFGARP